MGAITPSGAHGGGGTRSGLRMSFWGQFWLRTLTRVFAANTPRVYSGNLAVCPCLPILVTCQQPPPAIRHLRPVTCWVRHASLRAGSCTVRRLSQPHTRVHAVCAPSANTRPRSLSATTDCRVRKLVFVRATLPVSHRVLLCRRQPAVRARVRLLPRRTEVYAEKLSWACQTRRAIIQRFRCRGLRSSLVWQLPIARYAVPVERLSTDHRRQCRDALHRAAKGYARVQSVYYPVPAHAVARIEIDERLGVLYMHPRKGNVNGEATCLWVVSGVHLADGRPVRALLKVA